jgi:hypothetical protein
LGALSRAFAGGMRTLHVFGLCVALPLCAERNVFQGAVADGMRALHARLCFASQLHVHAGCMREPFVRGWYVYVMGGQCSRVALVVGSWEWELGSQTAVVMGVRSRTVGCGHRTGITDCCGHGSEIADCWLWSSDWDRGLLG